MHEKATLKRSCNETFGKNYALNCNEFKTAEKTWSVSTLNTKTKEAYISFKRIRHQYDFL